MLQLTIRSPESEAGQSCSISGSSVTIGRNRLNDLCLVDGTVSDFHAEIVPDGHGGWKVNDHDSSNGTFLNNARVKSKPVRSGDTLTFGGVETVVEPAAVDAAADTDTYLDTGGGGELDVPEVVAQFSPSEEVSDALPVDLSSTSSLPTAQIEQAMAMHRARISGRVDTVDNVPAKEVDPSAESKATASAPAGEIAQMHDRLKHALDELQALKDKHAIQTRELERYQERADLLEDPDADVTKLRIQLSSIKRKWDGAENKLKEKEKDVAGLENRAIQLAEKTAEKTAEVENLDKQVAELEKANSAFKKQEQVQSKLEKRIAELEEQAEQSDGEVVAENEKLNLELERSGEQNAALEARLAEAGEKINELEESMAGRGAEVVSKVAALSVVQTELDEKEEAISTAEETEAELRTSVAEQEKTISELNAKIKNLPGESDNVTEQLAKSRLKIESLKEQLATLQRQQSEAGAAGKILEKLEAEADALRSGMEELKQEREQMQSDLDAERVSLRATLKESEKETEAAGEKLKTAEHEVQAKRRELDGELEELQSEVIIERQQLEDLTNKAETVEQRVQKASALVEETAERWDKAEAGAKKEERRLAGLRRKLKRRRKLLEKLKGIGRREQALKRKIAEAQELLRAAEEHKPGKAAPAMPRPWDVDKAVEDYAAVLRKSRDLEEELRAKKAEWEKIDKDVQAGRGPLGDGAKEIDVDEFSAAVARNEDLENTVERLEIEKRSLIDTVSAMKAKIAAAGASASGSVAP